jgi:hypothetical protein
MPEVEVVGMVLYFGSPDATDGGGDQLQITHVSASAFWGKWATDLGIAVVMDTTTGKALADPAGWFCSYRRTSLGR